jgi:dihydrofolate synthase/folylpolyglutamate synthase
MSWTSEIGSGVQRQLDRLTIALARCRHSRARPRENCSRRSATRIGRLPPVFHVAGTNGKGSTCAYLRAAIEAAGMTAHVYTSPHLVRFNERIRIAGN